MAQLVSGALRDSVYEGIRPMHYDPAPNGIRRAWFLTAEFGVGVAISQINRPVVMERLANEINGPGAKSTDTGRSIWVIYCVENRPAANEQPLQEPQEVALVLVTGTPGSERFFQCVYMSTRESITLRLQAGEVAPERLHVDTACTDVEFVTPIAAYRCTTAELAGIVMTSNLPRPTILASILVSLFPHVLDNLPAGILVLPFCMTSDVSGVEIARFEVADDARKAHEFAIGIMIHVVLPSYNTETKTNDQVRRRVNAMLQSIGMELIPEGRISQRFTSLLSERYTPQGSLTVLIGMVVSTDSEGVYNSEATLEQLGSPQELMELWNLCPLALAVLEGMRLVYERIHCTTALWAVDMANKIRPHVKDYEEPWRTELSVVETMGANLVGKPYAGLVVAIPKSRRIASYPRIAAIAVLYQRECHKAAGTSETFSAFNVDGVVSHLSEQQDKDTAELLAKVIPTHRLIARALVLESSTRIDWGHLVAGLTETERLQVRNYLMKTAPDCAWIKAELGREGREAMERFSAKIIEQIVNPLEASIPTHLSIAYNMESAEQRGAALAAIQSTRDGIADLRIRMAGGAEAMAAGIGLEATQEMRALYDLAQEVARRLTYQR